MPQFGKRSLDSLKGVHPNLVKVMKEAIKTSPIDFTITDGGRTAAEQQKLYAQGRTAPGNIVTKLDGVTRKSNHQAKADGYYYAVDLYPYLNGKIDFHAIAELIIIADHIKAVARQLDIAIGWGGDWEGSWDKPHFELLKKVLQ